MLKPPNSAAQIRAKIHVLMQDVVYQKRYIAGLQNADLFPLAFQGLAHLEKTLGLFQKALDPSHNEIEVAGRKSVA